MEKSKKAEELMKTLQSIGPLEDVPTDVSARFQETLASLARADSQSNLKKNWLTGANQFALAASFTLVFALGAVFALNSGGESGGSIIINQSQTGNTPEEDDFKDDQLLYTAGKGSVPQTSNTPIKLSNSTHDYVRVPSGFQRTLGVGSTWNSADTLEASTVKCLMSLELDKSTNLIDTGLLNEKVVKAIWTPVGSSSWNIYLIDAECNVLEKKFFRE